MRRDLDIWDIVGICHCRQAKNSRPWKVICANKHVASSQHATIFHGSYSVEVCCSRIKCWKSNSLYTLARLAGYLLYLGRLPRGPKNYISLHRVKIFFKTVWAGTYLPLWCHCDIICIYMVTLHSYLWPHHWPLTLNQSASSLAFRLMLNAIHIAIILVCTQDQHFLEPTFQHPLVSRYNCLTDFGHRYHLCAAIFIVHGGLVCLEQSIWDKI